MKLLLTSTGFTNQKIRDFFVSQFDALENKKACLIYTIRQEGDWQWVERYDSELKEIGLQYDGVNISEEKDLSDLQEYDIYYVCGGNTFYILGRLRKTNLDKVILKAVEEGKFYVGVSAGSIVVGPDIEVAGIGEGDENDINLSDLSGFNWVPFHISPHYTEQDKNDVEEFYNKRKESLIALTDDQALFVTDKEVLLVGNKGVTELSELNIIDEE
ncbi:MAG: Type 1 glutamine amidotransferase-like domain-containing protein [Parcubacteria group bacterium]|jgi:dipeptidase E